MKNLHYVIPDEGAMEALGKKISQVLRPGLVVYLKGDLGAGKTTLVRGILRGLGYQDTVKSPTFTLVEPYDFSDYTLYHFDFYRLNSPLELEGMGIRDYFSTQALCLIEWPEKGTGFCAAPDIELGITINNTQREVSILAHNNLATDILQKLEKI